MNNTTPNTLSPELKAQIDKEAMEKGNKIYNSLRKDTSETRRCDYSEGWEDGYVAGRIETTLKLQQAEERIKELEQWKEEAKMLLDPLLNWGHAQKDIPLGMSVTNEILRRAKLYTKAEEMMEKMAIDLKLIQKWCEDAGLKAVAVDNPVHKAVYHSLHQSKQSLTEYNNYKQQKDD